MNLADASKNGKQLKCIKCSPLVGIDGFSSLSLLFDDGSSLCFRVNEDTDELLYGEELEPRSDLREVLPEIASAYGLSVVWSWEMKNQQGYFDAAQLELSDSSMSQSVVLQLKVATSMINVYTVEKLLQRC